MGTLLLPTCLPVLQFCAAPHRVVDLRYPVFSLWCLQPHPRKLWLSSVLTFFYKYEYSHHPLSGQALSLVRIVLNTIDNHYHRCRKVDDPTLCAASSAYSREVSQGSLGGNEGEHPNESPPLSPVVFPGGGRVTLTKGGPQTEPRAQYFHDHKSAFAPAVQDTRSVVLYGSAKPSGVNDDRKGRKNNDSGLSVDCDDVEPELEAIPESPKTDSPICQELCDLEPYENLVFGEQAVMRVEHELGSKAFVTHTPCTVSAPETATASVIVPQTIRVQAVTSVMASQIQAFDESFTVKIHNAELAAIGLNPEDNERIVMASLGGNGGHNDDNYRHKWFLGDEVEEGSNSELQRLDRQELKHSPGSNTRYSKSSQHFDDEVFKSVDTFDQSKFDNPERSSRERLLPVGIAAEKCVTPEKGCSIDTSQELQMNRAVICEMPTMEKAVIAQATVMEANVYEPVAMENVTVGEARVVSEVHSSQIHHRSPQSPLSMMDLMTLGSPVELDGQTSTTVDSPSTEMASPPDALKLPTPERLLPVGGEKTSPSKKQDDHQPGSILERVWQVFGEWTNGSKSRTVSSSDGELVEVVSHKDGHKVVKQKEIGNQRVPIDKHDQANTSTEEATDTSNSGTTTNNSGPADMCAGKGGMRHSKSKPVSVESEDESGNDGYRWNDHNTCNASVRGGVTSNDPPGPPPPPSIKMSALRVGEDCMVYRCMECGEIMEEFSNDDLGLCIIILSTFVYRQPDLAAPLLPRMLKTVARMAGSEVFSWQYESAIHFPGSATSIGRQFLRCVLHQLAPNQIFNQIFYTSIEEHHRLQLFKTLAQALTDFNELNPSAPIQLLLENLNSRKILPTENLLHLLGNVALYMECVGQDGGGGLTSGLVPLFDTFLRKVLLSVNLLPDLNPVLRILVAVLKIPGVSAHKSLLDPVSKLVSHAIQNSPMKYEYLSDLCHLCNRIFSRERDKLLLPRLVVYELVQALKFKTSIPDTNLVLLVQLVVQDSGGTLGSNSVVGDLPKDVQDIHNLPSTCAAECMRSHLHDALEFIADVHTLTKVKSNCRASVGLNEDTMGGLVKAGISQYIALEITRGNSRDNRAISKYLPWLNNPPTAVQQGPKEFIDCVSHIRLLSWLLLGGLTHTCLVGNSATMICQPIPPEASCHIADHIQVILAGFAEQSKASVLHMSSLFHAFILCQLWTVYLEQGAGSSPGCESYGSISAILTDFWAKVTPGILQLVSHSKVLGEMVNLHFLSLMEALHECRSTVLTKLLPLWAPVLYTHHTKLPGQLAVRLQACQNAAPPIEPDSPTPSTTSMPNLLRWLHRLQFKMGQIELQSSAATQFYSV